MRHVLTVEEVRAAQERWGANCGPAALAAVTGFTLDTVRPHLLKFDEKRYTNPAMMRGALRGLGVEHTWKVVYLNEIGGWNWPAFGLCRIQWCGPWTALGVPPRVAYRHTHWIGFERAATDKNPCLVFDINAIGTSLPGGEAGWIPLEMWADKLVPWLLDACEPGANGEWYATHVVEVKKRV